jgi:hypothetical protein
MKKVLLAAIVVAIAIGAFLLPRGRERKIQFLQKGTPLAAASVSFLGGGVGGPTITNLTTSANGDVRLPDGYIGGWVSIRVTKQGSVIAEFFRPEIPPGTTVIDFVSSNRTITTRKRSLFGGAVVETSSWDGTDMSGKGEPGGSANRSRPAGPGTNQTPPAAGSGG